MTCARPHPCVERRVGCYQPSPFIVHGAQHVLVFFYDTGSDFFHFGMRMREHNTDLSLSRQENCIASVAPRCRSSLSEGLDGNYVPVSRSLRHSTKGLSAELAVCHHALKSSRKVATEVGNTVTAFQPLGIPSNNSSPDYSCIDKTKALGCEKIALRFSHLNTPKAFACPTIPPNRVFCSRICRRRR